MRNKFWKRIRKSYFLSEVLIRGSIPVLPRRLAFLYRFFYPSRPITPSPDGFEFGGKALFSWWGGTVLRTVDRAEGAGTGYIKWTTIRYSDMRVRLVRDALGLVYMKTDEE